MSTASCTSKRATSSPRHTGRSSRRWCRLGSGGEQRLARMQHWLGAGSQEIETLLAEHPSSGAPRRRPADHRGYLSCHAGNAGQDLRPSTRTLVPGSLASMTISWPSRLLPMPTLQISPTRNRRVRQISMPVLVAHCGSSPLNSPSHLLALKHGYLGGRQDRVPRVGGYRSVQSLIPYHIHRIETVAHPRSSPSHFRCQ